MNEVVGYATIKKDATTGVSIDLPSFLGQDVRVLEFSKHDGSVLVVNREATALGTFEKEDVYRSFECSVIGDVICPPGLNFIEQIAYQVKVHSRKGGYVPLLKGMVIQASLMKGRLYDDFLFQYPT